MIFYICFLAFQGLHYVILPLLQTVECLFQFVYIGDRGRAKKGFEKLSFKIYQPAARVRPGRNIEV